VILSEKGYTNMCPIHESCELMDIEIEIAKGVTGRNV
jgi:hypothetical protein